ncbi:MAG TPA: efflux RND transporter periplasmic adaptor subunit [Bacteroidales bacterium]|nr:efflux RND transporter periplasmic adaptor subunit [Bacteroidales bacterium]
MVFLKKFYPYLIALGVIVIIILAVGKKKGWLGPQNAIKISTEQVERRDITEVVSANGKIQPEVEVKVSPDISGEVIELHVKEGDEVQAGDLLAVIDPEIYRSTLDRAVASLNTQKANEANAQARLAQARAQFTNGRLSFERSQKLWKDGAISAAEFDAAKASYEVAEAEVLSAEQGVKAAAFTVRSAEASVKESRESLQKTSIYAPTHGTVSRLNVEKGERVVGASQFSSGTEIMRIANLNSMEVSVSVNENDIVRVSLGDTCIVEVDSYLDRDFRGVVTEIATSAIVSGVSVDQVTNFDVKVRILAESYADMVPEGDARYSPFRPGMSATVDIQTEKVRKVLTVPIQAVTTRSGNDSLMKATADSMDLVGKEEEEIQEVVFIYEEGKARMVNVSTGIQDNAFIQITAGLEEGQEVITAPYRAVSRKLKDGDAVNKVPKEELFTDKEK